MKFAVRINIETTGEFDEGTLEMYIASQLMGGPVQLEVVGVDAGEVDEFEHVGVYYTPPRHIFKEGDLVRDQDDNLYNVREVSDDGIYVDDLDEAGNFVDAGCFALDELTLDMPVEDQRNKLFPYG